MDEVVEIHGVPVHLVCRDALASHPTFPNDERFAIRCWTYEWEALVGGRTYGGWLRLDTLIFTQARDILLSQARYQIERAQLHV